MKTVRWWVTDADHRRRPDRATILASTADTALALARGRWGHHLYVGTMELRAPIHRLRPDPLPEVEAGVVVYR